MSRIYLQTAGPHDWQWHLARPNRHWKHGASSMALADAWEEASPSWPPAVQDALAKSHTLRDLELLLALPEHEVPLPGGSRASQTDLLVFAQSPEVGLVVIAVEGKCEEPFGDQTVADWRAQGGGREERLAYLLQVLRLSDNDALGHVRYQLVHRTASALIEARRFGAKHAVMLVHSFSSRDSWFDDFADFAALFGVDAQKDTCIDCSEVDGINLRLAWVSDAVPLINDALALKLGHRFDRAFAYARDLHRFHDRKETEIPYISHLMGVASIVLEDGGNENEAIAALLHDAVEDQGGAPVLKDIRHQFGDDVAAIVSACSDTDVTPKPPWRNRKAAYIEHLGDPKLPDGAVRVSLADKLHNARSILFDLRAGQDVFARFSAPVDDQLWYYRTLAETFSKLTDSPMVASLASVVDEIEADLRAAKAPARPAL